MITILETLLVIATVTGFALPIIWLVCREQTDWEQLAILWMRMIMFAMIILTPLVLIFN